MTRNEGLVFGGALCLNFIVTKEIGTSASLTLGFTAHPIFMAALLDVFFLINMLLGCSQLMSGVTKGYGVNEMILRALLKSNEQYMQWAKPGAMALLSSVKVTEYFVLPRSLIIYFLSVTTGVFFFNLLTLCFLLGADIRSLFFTSFNAMLAGWVAWQSGRYKIEYYHDDKSLDNLVVKIIEKGGEGALNINKTTTALSGQLAAWLDQQAIKYKES